MIDERDFPRQLFVSGTVGFWDLHEFVFKVDIHVFLVLLSRERVRVYIIIYKKCFLSKLKNILH